MIQCPKGVLIINLIEENICIFFTEDCKDFIWFSLSPTPSLSLKKWKRSSTVLQNLYWIIVLTRASIVEHLMGQFSVCVINQFRFTKAHCHAPKTMFSVRRRGCGLKRMKTKTPSLMHDGGKQFRKISILLACTIILRNSIWEYKVIFKWQ